MSAVGRLLTAATRGVGVIQAGSFPDISIDQWAAMFTDPGSVYGQTLITTLKGQPAEVSDGSFIGMVMQAYRANGIVFAVMLARLAIFSQARFQFQQMNGGVPGELFGTDALSLLEHPWPNGTTGDLLARMIQDVDLAGNAYVVRRPTFLKRLRPDWVAIILGTENDPAPDPNAVDAQIAGYMYVPGGFGSGFEPVFFLPEEMAHFAPIPDPLAHYRGMSWLTPIVREIAADGAATTHKLKFFENGATPNLVISLDPKIDATKFRDWVKLFKEKHEGVRNAYRTLYLGAGATVTPVGKDLQQLDFKITQGAGETRIASAGGVPVVIVGFSEGLQGSALNEGNFTAAKRRFADMTIRPLWGNVSGSLETIVSPPRSNTRLWYDDHHIPFLADDVKDAASVLSLNAASIQTLINAGFRPDAVISAVTAGDLKSLLKQHTGLFSVQLQPIADGTEQTLDSAAAQIADPATQQAARALLAVLRAQASVPQLTPGGQSS